jgi:hypothetical protein
MYISEQKEEEQIFFAIDLIGGKLIQISSDEVYFSDDLQCLGYDIDGEIHPVWILMLGYHDDPLTDL